MSGDPADCDDGTFRVRLADWQQLVSGVAWGTQRRRAKRGGNMSDEPLTGTLREMATSYVLVHSRLINKHVRDNEMDEALKEAGGVVAALERLVVRVPKAAGLS